MFLKFISFAFLAVIVYFLYRKVILPSLRGESISISSKKDELIAAAKQKREAQELKKMAEELTSSDEPPIETPVNKMEK